MRPVVVTAVLLLVVLMSMSASAAWNPGEMCRTKFPATPCIRDFGKGWYQTSTKKTGTITCVKVFQEHLVYKDAERACRRNRRGHLVSITSLVELCQVECAMYRATPKKAHYWIGLFQKGKGFAWTDRKNYGGFKHWARGEPNSWRSEHCVEMNFRGWGRWNDQRCYRKRPYVCQVDFWQLSNLFNFWA